MKYSKGNKALALVNGDERKKLAAKWASSKFVVVSGQRHGFVYLDKGQRQKLRSNRRGPGVRTGIYATTESGGKREVLAYPLKDAPGTNRANKEYTDTEDQGAPHFGMYEAVREMVNDPRYREVMQRAVYDSILHIKSNAKAAPEHLLLVQIMKKHNPLVMLHAQAEAGKVIKESSRRPSMAAKAVKKIASAVKKENPLAEYIRKARVPEQNPDDFYNALNNKKIIGKLVKNVNRAQDTMETMEKKAGNKREQEAAAEARNKRLQKAQDEIDEKMKKAVDEAMAKAQEEINRDFAELQKQLDKTGEQKPEPKTEDGVTTYPVQNSEGNVEYLSEKDYIDLLINIKKNLESDNEDTAKVDGLLSKFGELVELKGLRGSIGRGSTRSRRSSASSRSSSGRDISELEIVRQNLRRTQINNRSAPNIARVSRTVEPYLLAAKSNLKKTETLDKGKARAGRVVERAAPKPAPKPRTAKNPLDKWFLSK